MEQNFIIYIGIWKVLSIITSILAGCWYLSSRLSKVETKVDLFETRLVNMDGRIDNLYSHGSPMRLNPRGISILETSGFKDYIDNHKEKMIEECCSNNSLTTQYDIQEHAFKFIDTYDFGDFEDKLKESAYNDGTNLEVVKRIGGLYFRDILLEKYNFKPEDLDKPKG